MGEYTGEENGKTRKILIVEDEGPILRLLINQCAVDSLKAFGARDGKAGLALALKERPDFILLDLLMPKMDGMTMLKKLRDDKWGAHVPVVVVTNFDNEITRQDAQRYNVVDFMAKSDLRIDNLTRYIRQSVNK